MKATSAGGMMFSLAQKSFKPKLTAKAPAKALGYRRLERYQYHGNNMSELKLVTLNV